MNESAAEFLIAFLGVWPSDDGEGTLGAAMVTSERGYPLEFRVSTAVRPSAIQRALYGDSLDGFVSGELIYRRLISDLQRKPTCGLINRRSMLESTPPFPLAFVAAADEVILTVADRVAFQRIDGLDGLSPSLMLVSPDTAALQEVADRVRAASRNFDPLAAFDRMRTAVRVLGESDARYR